MAIMTSGEVRRARAEMNFMPVAVEERRCDLLRILVPPHSSTIIVFGSRLTRGKRRVKWEVADTNLGMH